MWHRQLLEPGEPPSLGPAVEPLPPGRGRRGGGSQEGRGAQAAPDEPGCPSRSAPSSSESRRHHCSPSAVCRGASGGASGGSTLRSGAKFSHLANWRRNEQCDPAGIRTVAPRGQDPDPGSLSAVWRTNQVSMNRIRTKVIYLISVASTKAQQLHIAPLKHPPFSALRSARPPPATRPAPGPAPVDRPVPPVLGTVCCGESAGFTHGRGRGCFLSSSETIHEQQAVELGSVSSHVIGCDDSGRSTKEI
ncbi:unnamed protein product [Pleuronectes platessa]|uniref:Uncharacterized protein n=1 Tax=Pleuronectes platessa TaxID=8262 RepID=A0A9N7TQH7_PLEPL|nr:unnamed protein product [Pleuronectes platessa]